MIPVSTQFVRNKLVGSKMSCETQSLGVLTLIRKTNTAMTVLLSDQMLRVKLAAKRIYHAQQCFVLFFFLFLLVEQRCGVRFAVNIAGKTKTGSPINLSGTSVGSRLIQLNTYRALQREETVYTRIHKNRIRTRVCVITKLRSRAFSCCIIAVIRSLETRRHDIICKHVCVQPHSIIRLTVRVYVVHIVYVMKMTCTTCACCRRQRCPS